MSYTTVTRLLANGTVVTGAPTLAGDGVAVPASGNARDATISIYSTAGSVTMSVTIRLWGYVANSFGGVGRWLPLGIGTAALKGVLNNGAAIDETVVAGVGNDLIQHAEPIALATSFDRLYAQVTAITGTATAVCVDLVTARYG